MIRIESCVWIKYSLLEYAQIMAFQIATGLTELDSLYTMRAKEQLATARAVASSLLGVNHRKNEDDEDKDARCSRVWKLREPSMTANIIVENMYPNGISSESIYRSRSNVIHSMFDIRKYIP